MADLFSRLRTWMSVYGKVISLVVTMLIGALVPQVSAFSFMVQYLLMTMLFFAFLDIEVNPKNFHKGVIWVLLANLAVAFIAYETFSRFSADLGLAAFITAIAPLPSHLPSSSVLSKAASNSWSPPSC